MHKKYTYKDGKKFGPYYYETKRVDGKVITTYLGISLPKNISRNNLLKNLAIFSAFILLILVIYFISFNFTGNVSLDIKTNYNFGEDIEGELNLNLLEGELLPADSLIIVNYGNLSKEFSLSELISDDLVEGKFYAEGVSLSGEGQGYGVAGQVKEYPVVQFKLNIFDEDESLESSDESSPPEEPAPEPGQPENNGGETPEPEQTNELEGPSESESSSSSESPGEPGITGAAITTLNIIDGQTSQQNPFTYSLFNGQTARLVEGSVYYDGSFLEDDSVDVKVNKDEVAVSTDYFIEKEGFGEEYIGGKGKKISIDLSSMGLIADSESVLSIFLVYGGQEILEASEEITIADKKAESGNGAEESEGMGGGSSIEIPIKSNDSISINDSSINKTIIPDNSTGINQTGLNKTLINETLVNITELNNTFVNESLVNVSLVQFTARIGQPVRWVKEVSVEDINKNISLVVEIPISAENITIGKIKSGKSADEPTAEVMAEEIIEGQDVGQDNDDTNEPNVEEIGETTEEVIIIKDENDSSVLPSPDVTVGITGKVTANIELKRETLFSKLLSFFRFTGRAIDEDGSDVKEIYVQLEQTDTGVEIEYYTDAPVASEEIVSEDFKRVLVSSPSDVHYENVFVFTNLSDTLKISDSSVVKIEWVEDNTRLEVYSMNDSNQDGYYDYVEWIAPQLSNQTFNIIIIIDAKHLDENRTFVSNIYNETKELDGVWSETIPESHYIRITFETNLTSVNDITIWPRIVSGSPIIDVYEINGEILLEQFNNLTENSYNKIYLTNLTGEQDTFDLLVLNGSIEFDHIIDPSARPNATSSQIELRAQTCIAMESSIDPNSYGSSCLGTYPALCNSDRISCQEGTYEQQSLDEGTYAGIRITVYNETVRNCKSIDKVFLCYAGYYASETFEICDIYYDSNGGASENTLGVCPDPSAPGITGCVDVTSTESWNCANFFGTSGTRARVRTEVQNTLGGLQTLNMDGLYFIVNYTTDGPDFINMSSPVNGSTTSSRSVNLTLSINDSNHFSGSNLNDSIIYVDTSLPFTNQHPIYYSSEFPLVNGNIYLNYSNPPLKYNSTQGMFLLYHFDNNSYYGENLTRVTDFATFKFNGTTSNVNGEREKSKPGLGKAYEVDSNERIVLSDDPLLDSPNITRGITIMFWFNLSTNISVTSNAMHAVMKQSGGSRDYGVWFINSSKDLVFGTSNGTGGEIQHDTIASFANSTWYHYAITFNATNYNATSYVNGIIDKSTIYPTRPNLLIDSSGNLEIGGSSSTNYFLGLIDDVALFNKTLTAAEILDIYRLREGKYYVMANVSDTYGGYNSSSIYSFTVSSNAVDSCGVLNVAGTTYTQSANIFPSNPTAPCINITANNITFNGNGFSIYNTTFTNRGIYALGRTNITIQNVNVTVNSANSNANGIEFVATNSSIIINSSFNSNYRGMNLGSNSNNNIIQNITVNNNSQSGIYLPNAKNNLFDNITLNSNSYAFEFAGPSSNGLSSNNIIKNFNANLNNNGIYFEMASNQNNSFVNGTINGSRNNAIYLFSSFDISSIKNTSFINLNVVNTNLSYRDLVISQYDESNLYIESFNLVNTFLSNYSIAKAGGPVNDYVVYLTVEDTRYGEIKFLSPINGSGTNLTADVQVLNNSATVRSNVNSGLNKSANVTLRGISTVFDTPFVARDGAACTNCYNFTSLNAGTVVFNVSGWTNYSIRSAIQYPPYNGTTLVINSTLGLNRTREDLNVRTTLLDLNNNAMNVTSRWYNNSILAVTQMHNSSYANGSTFIATLGFGNTTKGQNWSVQLTINDGGSSFSVNSSNLTILNTPPNVTLISPANNSNTINRTNQLFTWVKSDDDGESTGTTDLVNISLVATSLCTDANYNGATTYSVNVGGQFDLFQDGAGPLNCLIDNGDHYLWSVQVSDGSYGPFSAPFRLDVSAYLNAVMNISAVQFGNLGYLHSNDTVDNSPQPIIIINEGNALNNIKVHATNLWNSVANPSRYFQFKFDNVSTNGIFENNTFKLAGTVINYTNVSSSVPSGANLVDLNYTNSADSVEVDFNVTVPSTEGPGYKNSTITFTIELGSGDTYAQGGEGVGG